MAKTPPLDPTATQQIPHQQQYAQPGWGQQPPPAGWGAPGFPAPSAPKKPWYMKKLVIIPAALLAVVVVANAGGGSSETVTPASNDAASTAAAPAAPAPAAEAPAAEAPAAPAPAAEAPAPAEAAIVTSAQEMITLLESNALKAKQTYEDKQVTVTGFVGSIDASGDYFALDPEPGALIFTGVQVQTSKKFQDQLANFSEGQPVTVTGKITNVGEIMGYSLKAETIG